MSGAGGQGDDKNSMALLWVVGFIFITGVILWYAFSEQLKYGFIKFRMLELYMISPFVKMLPKSFESVQLMQREVADALAVTKVLPPQGLSLTLAGQLSDVVGKYIRIPITILLGFFCYLMYGRNVKMRYRKRYDMNSLAIQESEVWPQINPVINAKIEEQDISNGPWAMALNPLEFCKKYKLIDVKAELPTSALNNNPKFNVTLNKDRASRLFASQLGKLWVGPERLPIHKRAIFAALIARGMRDTEKSRNLLQQINRSCAAGKLDKLNFSGCDALWKKHYKSRAIQDIINVHAFESTVFTALLLFAREDGVLATADFLWLKPFDRKFWYCLNNVGRQTAFCEAAGIHAHFLAERALRRSLSVPLVGEAIKGLDLALQDIIYIPTTDEADKLIQEAQKEAG